MIAIVVCLAAFIACYVAGRRSLGAGLVVLMFFGYFYGILRANLLTSFSHFIFDAGMVGLFVSPCWRTTDPTEKKRSAAIQMWTVVLILWPVLLVMLPFQPLLVSVVGLRGNTFFFPFLLIGSRLKEKDLLKFSVGLAFLNMVAVFFAGAEYFLGLMRFFPLSPVTEIMYSSQDAGGGFYRIPATFTSAHAFGGTMVASLPYLIGLWTKAETKRTKMLAIGAMAMAMVGVLMSATRSNFIYGSAMILFVLFTTKMKGKQKAFFLVIIAGIGLMAMTNARFQRFKTLGDTEGVTERIAGSVNRNFWEILSEYPMGNGLGGGGTSMPYFLQGQVRNPIGMENEYARILCEQGVLGLLLWVSFVVWFLFQSRNAFARGPWATSRRLVWCLAASSLATAFIGTGLLTSIPGTVFLVMGMGWTAVPEAREKARLARQPVPLRYAGRGAYTPALQ
jgi:hypothetical protein